MKKCPCCKEIKPLETEFHKNKNSNNGYNWTCKKCSGINSKRWASKNKERCLKNVLAWNERNPDKIEKYILLNRLRRIDKKLTIEDYDKLFAKCGGKCTICRTSDPGMKCKSFCIDHDHQTKRLRGLLCHNCNLTLGLLQDSPEIIESAIIYLIRHSDKQKIILSGMPMLISVYGTQNRPQFSDKSDVIIEKTTVFGGDL